MKILQASLIIIATSVLPSTTAWAKNLAGFVIVSVGDVTARDGETQQERSLKRRSKIFEGDEIRTGGGAKVQLKFKDKGVIALQENTELQISEFDYTGQEGAPEKSFFRLVKGGFRAISGAIGKQNPDDYRVETPLATIGIRGTDYGLKLGRVMGVKVNSGAVSVKNQAGEIVIGDGHDFRHALVSSATELPRGSLNPVRVLRNSVKNQVTEPADEEDIPEIDDDTVIRTERKAPKEVVMSMHSQEKDLSEQMAKEESEDKENDESDDSRTEGGSVEETAIKMEKVFATQLEDGDKIDIEEGETLAWGTMEKVVEELDDGTTHSDEEIEDSIETVSDGDTTASIDPGTTDPGTTDPGTTDPGTTDPGTTDPGTTDPGTTDPGTTDPGTTDARISDAELADIAGHWGVAVTDKQPDPNALDSSMTGGWARDESSGLPGLFIDRGAPPDDPNYSTLTLTDVLRQETHTNDQTVFALWDTNISTAVSAFSWGRWTGGEARLYTDSTDVSVFTSITEDIYWFTGSPADMTTVPSSGQARFEHVFLLAGNGSAGPVIEEDPTSIDIRFTIDWLNNTFSDGEMRLVNGVKGSPSQQTQWKFFNMAGDIQTSAGDPSPILNFMSER